MHGKSSGWGKEEGFISVIRSSQFEVAFLLVQS